MKSSIQKLHKFFNLEADRNFDNKAVMGGLHNMLISWEPEARADGLSDELIEAVVIRLRDYDRLSETSRKEALHGLWKRIQRETDAPETQVGSPPAQRSQPKEVAPEPQPQEEETSKDEPQETPTQPEEQSLPQKTEPTVKRHHEAPPEGPSAALNAEVTILNGVGPRYAKTLTRLGIHTLGNMLYHFPRRYDDYSQLKPISQLNYKDEVTVIGSIHSVSSRKTRGGRTQLIEVVLSDGSGALKLSWFNQPWLIKRFRRDTQIVVSGKIDQYLGRLTMNNPEWETLEQKTLHTGGIVPVYPLTAEITQRWLRNRMNSVVTYWAPRVRDPLTEEILERTNLVDISTALLQIHFPESWEALRAAHERLAFDEIFLLQLGVLQQKQAWQERDAQIFEVPPDWLQTQLEKLPFQLTGAQQKVVNDIQHDLACGHPMNRLLQGDVGSGKTVVAALVIAMVTHNGAQAALMAPTSILAEQHYKNLLALLANEHGVLQDDQIRLMVGATPEIEKERIRVGLASGGIKLVVGTHALIEDPVTFANLELAISIALACNSALPYELREPTRISW
jgi:ATP-dependent DNA helicase RecG